MGVLENLRSYKILLASASPRRRELLSRLAINFEVAPGREVDESYPEDLPVEQVAQYLSKKKADAYRKDLAQDELLITADTVVINQGKVLGKPLNQAEASDMLRALSGHCHHVITGVTISSIDRQVSFSVETEVEFAVIENDEIEFYVNQFKPMDKAGAYGIQEWIGCMGVRAINGSFYNVMGLPLHRLYTELKNW